MAPVVGHVVTAEGQHSEGVVAQGAGLNVGGGSGNLRGHGSTDEHAVSGFVLLGYQRHVGSAAATEEDGVDGYTLGGFPVTTDDRALSSRGGEAGVGVSGLLTLGSVSRGVVVAVPVDQVLGQRSVDALPPNVAVVGQSNVGEDGVGLHGVHGHRVGLVAGAGGDAEEASLGVDGAQAAVLTRTHPGDVVTNGLNLVARDGGLEHGQVGLTAGAGESGSYVVLLAAGLIGQTQDQHVLGHPAVAAGHGGGDTQGVALLAQQGVAAVTGTVGPNLVGLGEVGDVLFLVARPGGVFLTGSQRGTYRVHGGNPGAAFVNQVHGLGANAGHDAHVDYHVGGVGDLNTQLGDGAAEGTHGEGDHVHGAAGVGAVKLLVEDLLHLNRVIPVVGRTGVFFLLRTDEGARLHAGDVAGQRTGQEGVGALLGV